MENKGTDNAAPTDALDILSEIPAGAGAAPEPEATSLDNGPTSTTSALYRAAIGKVSTDFYQRVFDRFETAERTGPSWNWAAALITFNWMVFRKLWLAALVYVGAVVAALVSVLGLGKLVFQWSSPLEMGLLGLLALVFVVVPGIYGNALLHGACRKKMAQALAANTTVPEACAMLEQQASTKQRLIWIALANALLVGATVGISVALPDADRLPQSPGAMEQAPSAPGSAASAPNTTPIAPPPIPAASAPAAAMESAAPASSPAPAPAAAEPVAGAVPPTAPAPLPAPNKATAATIAAAPAAVVTSAPPAPLAPPAPAVVEKPAAPERPAAKTSNAPANKAAEKTQASATAAKAATSDAAAGKKIYINVGLFAKESNAHNAHDKLAKAGLPAKEQQVTGTKGTFTRVRVGPYKTMAAAEKAAEKIRGQGLEAVVVRQ
jgi:cell division protein FtsN